MRILHVCALDLSGINICTLRAIETSLGTNKRHDVDTRVRCTGGGHMGRRGRHIHVEDICEEEGRDIYESVGR